MKRSEKLRFEEMAGRYMDNHSSVNNSPATVKRNPSLVNALARHFGEKFLHEIVELDVERHKKARLDAGTKPSTINRELGLLRSVLNKAREWGIIINEIPRIDPFRVANTRVSYLEEAEALELAAACPEPLKSLVLLTLNTGMRRGELLKLRWTDVDFGSKLVAVRDTKSRKNRHVPMNGQVLGLLKARQKHGDGEFVFPGDRPGSHLSASYTSNWFRRIVR